MTAPKREIQYLVLPDATQPFLLARVRWPDVYQAISPVRPDWQDDPGLFDLPYAPASTRITSEEAEQLAAEWGARLPDEQSQTAGPSLIRRMPSDWSHLSTAERRAWSIVDERRPQPAAAAPAAAIDQPNARTGPTSTPPSRRRRWGRRSADPAFEPVLADGSAGS